MIIKNNLESNIEKIERERERGIIWDIKQRHTTSCISELNL